MEVFITEELPTYFMPVLGVDNMTVGVRAVAGVGGSPGCVYVLNGTAAKALEVSSGSTMTATNCRVKVSSCHDSEALSTSSGSAIIAQAIDVCGGYDCFGSVCDPTPETNVCDGAPCDKGEDPLAGLAAPNVPQTCDFTEFKLSSVGTPLDLYPLDPGTYCGGISIESGSHVFMRPGVYWIRGGGMSIASNSSAVGHDITVYNTEMPGYAYGPIEIQSNTVVTMTAPSGDSAGIFDRMLFWQDRNITGDYENKIESNTGSYFEGVLYFSDQHLMFHSNTLGVAGATYTVVIADTLEVSSGTQLGLSGGLLGEGLPEPTLVE